jgi:putative ABC transport system permease protein
MKASLYFNYTSRSLLRGGQRSVLAVFCVAVGVMAIVALQLVGQMINNAFTTNVRDANGGDIAVTNQSAPFTRSDLVFFDNLKRQGTITNYTPLINVNASIGLAGSASQSFSLQVVDPRNFPVVTPPAFKDPASGSLSTLLAHDQVVVDQNLLDQYGKKVGDSFTMHVGTGNGTAFSVPVRIVGIVDDSGVFAQSNDFMLIAQSDYQAADRGAALLYDTVDVVTANQAHTAAAAQAIGDRFRIASVTTADQALKNNQQQVDFIKKFLEVAGLLALLIGGVGIVNTMQVLLSRRRVEIAMLKTTGYRRTDLYLLFGLEAGLLGLVGGVVGATAAVGVSYLVRNIVQQLFPITIPFLLDYRIIGGGVVIGLVTALIFGLLPIVQAANIRPLNVIREIAGGNRVGSFFLTVALLLLLSVLFCLLAIAILNDVTWGISAVYGSFIFLALLSLFFGLVVLVISILPVPEHFSLGYTALLVGGVAVSALLYFVLPTFGIMLLVVSLFGFVVVLLPRTWKSNTKMALRNIGRQRGRTTTTLLALFVGVFTIGLILVLGQNLSAKINAVVAENLTFNLVAIARGSDATALQNRLGTIPGISIPHTQSRTYAADVPLAIDGTPIVSLLPRNDQPGPNNLGSSGVLFYLGGLEGYDVAHNQLPATQNTTFSGRNLEASDAGTRNALINANVADLPPLKGHIHLGSQLTLGSQDGKMRTTVTIVGFYKGSGASLHFGPVLTTPTVVSALMPAGQGISIFYMKIDTARVGKALQRIGSIAPNAGVYNFANIGDYINSVISDLLLVLTTIASLSLLAGVIIIANAVALAMLERRRELGILKSVGYTSGTIMGEVLIENGIVGGTGALLAMLLVTLATGLLGTLLFKSSFGVSWYIAIGLIVGIALLAMVTSALVAWGATRVRPLEVLRYE